MTQTLLLLAVAALPAANQMSLPEALAPAPAPNAAASVVSPAASIDALLAHPALPPVTSNLPPGAAPFDSATAFGSSAPSPWDLAGAALLILALAGATLWTRQRKRGAARHIQVVETASLGPKRSLALVVVGGQSLLLSCCDSGIFLVSSQPATAEMLQGADRSAAGIAGQAAPTPLFPQAGGPRAGFAAHLAEAEETQGLRRRLSEAGVLRVTPVLLVEPSLSLAVNGGGSTAVKMFLLLTALSFASALLVSVTSFTRITIVLSFLRQALGTTQLPPNQVLIGLALALSAFVMAPTASVVYRDALGPYLDDKISAQEAWDRGSAPVDTFLLRQTRPQDLQLFYEVSNTPPPARGDAIPMTIAVPAFMVSALTTAFRMGLFIYLPFIIIDLLVSAFLMSLGMMMLPPTLVSLPLKVGVFLLADGWRLLVASLVRSFG